MRTYKRSLFLLLILIFSFFNVDAAFAHAPHDVIFDVEMSPTYDQDQTLFVAVRGNVLKSTDGGYSWKRIVKGLDNIHRIFSLTISPHTKKTLFLSSPEAGIYKSQDGGSSWFKVNNGLGDLNIDLISIPFDSSDVVLAAGTEKGLYKTKNGGANWYQVIDDDRKVTAIAFFRDKKDHVIIGDDKGILFFSEDGGDTWKQCCSITNGGAITAIAVSPNFSSDSTFFVGTEKSGVFKTVDGGTSFLEANSGISDKFITSLAISPNYGTDFTILASTWYKAVFHSNDGGNTWKKYSKGLNKDAQANRFNRPHFSSLRISETFSKDKTVFLGGFNGLFKSADGGHVWEEMDTLPPSIIIGLALSPEYKDDSTVAITTYLGGAYITDDRGITWVGINKGLEGSRATKKGIIRLHDVVFSPNYRSDNTIFLPIKDFLLKSTDRGEHWDKIPLTSDYWGMNRLINAAHGKVLKWLPKWLNDFVESEFASYVPYVMAISPNFASDNTIYLGTREGAVFKSTEGGENLSIVGSLGQAINSLVISPDFPSDETLYAASEGEGVYKTVDGGYTWQPVNNNLVLEGRIKLAISPNYKLDKTVFAGTIGGLFKTQDGGKSWVKLAGSAYEGDGNVKAIAISPNYQSDQTLIISVKGRGLFKTVNGGETFTQVGDDLIDNNYLLSTVYHFPPASEPIEFSLSYAIDNTIYGTTGMELFRSTDGGNSWETITAPKYEEDRNVFKILYGLFVAFPILRVLAILVVALLGLRFLRASVRKRASLHS